MNFTLNSNQAIFSKNGNQASKVKLKSVQLRTISRNNRLFKKIKCPCSSFRS